jgi:hypothetical protein
MRERREIIKDNFKDLGLSNYRKNAMHSDVEKVLGEDQFSFGHT